MCRLIIGLFSVALVFGQTNPSPLKTGEILEYTAQFNVIPAGTATLEHLGIEPMNGYSAIHVQFKARTGTVADRIFKIRDRIDTWLKTDDLTTVKQEKKLREGKYRKQTQMVVDHKLEKIVTLSDTLEIEGDIRDPYSLLYYLRTISLHVGDTLSFNTFDNSQYTPLMVIIDKKETVSVPAGKFESYVFRPFKKDKSLFKNQGDMIIWFSDDERRLPVQIQIKLKFGSMLLRLKKVSYKSN
ncbi:MAG: DUF3108 domain-containing protein [Candidatus Marinimicrobia bacterium]|nr:DUF3108 domain-containing protein [Candidatus Neomarinimicrobiota bacterium]